MKKLLTALLFTFAFCAQASAAAKFLVLCTTACTWDNTNDAIWSTSSGGANDTTHPVAGDAVTLDANSCVGGLTCTITVAANLAMTSITMGACTASTTGCILDFSANNNNITLSTFSLGGSGTRTLNCGSGTWTLTATTGTVWDNNTITNETLTCNAGTILLSAVPTAGRTFACGNLKVYNTIQITNVSLSGFGVSFNTSCTFATVTSTNSHLLFVSNGVQTIGTLNVSGGTSTVPILIRPNADAAITQITTSGTNVLSGVAFLNVTKAGAGSITATNSFDLGGNTSVTITPPVAGTGGGFIIGGG